jgi:hypothetical protein
MSARAFASSRAIEGNKWWAETADFFRAKGKSIHPFI